MKNGGCQPRGYKVQGHFPCCANCLFGDELGDPKDAQTLYVCEIHGEPEDGDYHRIGTHPLGICDAWKPGGKKEDA